LGKEGIAADLHNRLMWEPAPTEKRGASGAIEVTPAAQCDDARAAIGVGANLSAQVTDMHVQAAVVQGQFAAQGDLCQLLLVQRLSRLAQQGLEQTAFGNGQGDGVLVDSGHAAHRAKAQVSQFYLAGYRGRVAAAQYSPQTGGQFAGVAGFGQIVIGAQLEPENTVQGFAAG